VVSKLDWSMVDGTVKRCQEKNSLETVSKAFPFFVLKTLFPYSEEDTEDLITEGGNDCGIDAVKIDMVSGAAHVHLFQFKYYESHEKTSKQFSYIEGDKVVSFIASLFSEDAALEQACNPYLWDKVQEIWSVIREAKTKFTIHFCSNGQKLDPHQKERFIGALSQYRINFEEIDFAKILNLIVRSGEGETSHQVTAVDKQYFERSDGDIRGLIVTINAEDLIRVIVDHEDGEKINGDIFDKNIRIYQGSDNPVNESIIGSALSESNSYFWYMNNGITAVCSGFSYQPGARSPSIEIKNLQIVNGAQTSYALFEAYKNNKEQVRNVLLLMRLYETKNENLPYDIAVATNSQTRISNRDLMSNSLVQIKLERAFEGFGYFYERKKGQYEDKEDERRIDAFKLGQAILAYHFREPEKSKTDSDKIFGSRYDEIFSSGNDVSYLLNIHHIFQKVDKLRSEMNQTKKKGALIQIDNFLTYGQFQIMYLVALLAERNKIDIATNVNQDRLIHDALEVMRRYVANRKSHSFYNLFRNPRTKQDLYDLAMQKGQLEFPLEYHRKTA
jgi:hypothetical protein